MLQGIGRQNKRSELIGARGTRYLEAASDGHRAPLTCCVCCVCTVTVCHLLDNNTTTSYARNLLVGTFIRLRLNFEVCAPKLMVNSRDD